MDVLVRPDFLAVSGVELDNAIEAYNPLRKLARKNSLSDAQRLDYEYLSGVLQESLQLVNVTSQDQDILEQLVNRDDVHNVNVSSVDDILNYRSSGDETSKQTFALVKPDNGSGKRQVLTAIYGHFDCVSTDVNGDVAYSELKGDVSALLTAEATDMKAPNLVTFFSVTNLGGLTGAGSILIDKSHAYVRSQIPSVKTVSTLSPARAYKAWAEAGHVSDMRYVDEQDKNRSIVRYVTDPSTRDLARNLHIFDNGAALGRVHSRANSAGTLDDVYGDGQFVPLVNYIYALDPKVLEDQRQRHARGEVTLDPHLNYEADML